jgi:hypothetical protein
MYSLGGRGVGTLPAPAPPVREENAMPFDGASFEALDKIDKVIDLLAREDRWCKHQLRR